MKAKPSLLTKKNFSNNFLPKDLEKLLSFAILDYNNRLFDDITNTTNLYIFSFPNLYKSIHF